MVGAIDSSVEVLGFSFSLTLSVVADIAGNWDIVGVNARSALETNTVEELGISFRGNCGDKDSNESQRVHDD